MGRYSNVRNRRLHRGEVAVERFASSRVGAWLFLHVFHRIDTRVLALSRGRLSVVVGAPVGMLDAVGARSGRVRRTPLLYSADGDRVVLIASNGGAPRHPAWYHNVRANPDVHFLTRDGARRAYRATVAHGPERERLWLLATDVYSGYAAYQLRARPREIPVVVLESPPIRHRLPDEPAPQRAAQGGASGEVIFDPAAGGREPFCRALGVYVVAALLEDLGRPGGVPAGGGDRELDRDVVVVPCVKHEHRRLHRPCRGVKGRRSQSQPGE